METVDNNGYFSIQGFKRNDNDNKMKVKKKRWKSTDKTLLVRIIGLRTHAATTVVKLPNHGS